MQFLENLRAFRYFNEVAFVVALLLLLGAWKFGKESLADIAG